MYSRSLLIFLLFIFSPSFCQGIEDKKSILYLNSYHNGYQWSDGLLQGFRNALNESGRKIDLQIEYMDTKKFGYSLISENLHGLYKEKFRDEPLDIVIAADNNALNFVNQFRDSLFPGLPVVFCGINDLAPNDTASGNITGVVEVFDLTGTLQVARHLHPKKNRLVVLIDESTTGRAITMQVKKFYAESGMDMQLEFWIQLSLEEAQKRVEGLGDNAFLFIAPYYQTINGRFYTSEEVSEAISRHSSVPIYTAWQFMIGYGAVGGRVISGEAHGHMAGEMALKILDGKRIEDIPIVNGPSGIYLFDHNAMTRLGIQEKDLPAQRKIINAPDTIYSLSKELFWTIMVSFLLLLLAFVAVVATMIERRKVELQITDQLAFQETLMDTIPQLVSWKNREGKYLGANRAFMEFFGINDFEQLKGKNVVELVRDKEYGQWSYALDFEVVKKEKAFRRMRRQVSEDAWLEVNKVPLRGQGGRLLGVLSTADNITKELNLENQLRQSQKMEAIGTLAGGISHDFNNILTSIINSTELAIGDVEEGSQTEADLKRVLKAARRGGQVVQQILSFSRPSTEGFQPTDLSRIVKEVVQLMETSTPANIEIKQSIEGANHFFANANPTQIHQALLNLSTNAYHALKSTGGSIDIQLSRHQNHEGSEFTPETDGKKFLRLAVIDNGPGISPEIADKIFDPFFSTKSITEGTGLGLAVVHGIVKSHQGHISVTSDEQQTIFEILLPETLSSEKLLSMTHTLEPESGGNILFVEDDEDQLETTPRLLETMGYSVTALRDPLQAFALASSDGTFKLLLSDFDMPKMSGAELAGRLQDIPTILISGREDAKTAAAAYPNIVKVIIKPYSKNDLLESIREALANG